MKIPILSTFASLAFADVAQKPIQVEQVNKICKAPVDLVFLVDTSASISDADMVKTKEFIKKTAMEFNVGPGKKQTRVSFVAFANEANTKFTFDNQAKNAVDVNQYIEDIYKAYDPATGSRLEGIGNTCPSMGMQNVLSDVLCDTCTGARKRAVNGGATNQKTVVIFLTDGRPYCTYKECADAPFSKFSKSPRRVPFSAFTEQTKLPTQACEDPLNVLNGADCNVCHSFQDTNNYYSNWAQSKEQHHMDRREYILHQYVPTFHSQVDTVISVGVGKSMSDPFLQKWVKKMAYPESTPDMPTYFFIPEFDKLTAVVEEITKEACPVELKPVNPTYWDCQTKWVPEDCQNWSCEGWCKCYDGNIDYSPYCPSDDDSPCNCEQYE